MISGAVPLRPSLYKRGYGYSTHRWGSNRCYLFKIFNINRVGDCVMNTYDQQSETTVKPAEAKQLVVAVAQKLLKYVCSKESL